MWGSGECIINLFFLAMILCLENVFVAPCCQLMHLSLGPVPETWAGRGET